MLATTDNGLNASRDGGSWTFLSNHAHVLLCIACHRDIRLRDVAAHIGITERAVQRIVADLEQGGYLSRSKRGRRNRYKLHVDRTLRHRLESHRKLCELLLLADGAVYQTGPPPLRNGLAARRRGLSSKA